MSALPTEDRIGVSFDQLSLMSEEGPRVDQPSARDGELDGGIPLRFVNVEVRSI